MKKRLLSIVLTFFMIAGLFNCFGSVTASAYTVGYDGLGPQKIVGNRDFKWPVPGNYNLQSCFYDHRNHCALDIAAPQGTAITAAYSGTVVKAVDGGTSYYGDGFGNYVVLRHNNYRLLNGSTVTLYSRYSHMYSVSVREGDLVSAGSILGKVGMTGYAEGNHLDFQILYGGWQPYQTYSIDPYSNYLLELPSNLVVYDSWACGTTYKNLITDLYKSNPTPNTEISLSGETAPTKLDVGQVFILKGTISSGAALTSVTVGVFDQASGGTMKTGRTVTPNSTSYNIANVDAYVEFNKLAAGTYYYRITATNSGGTEILLNQKFIVGTDYSISISGANTPSYFNVGHGMNIQGTISAGSALTNVTVGCYDSSGKMLTGKSVNPNSTSFNVNSIDADVRFSSLSPGVYTYRITATNSGGMKTLVEKVFPVLADTATVSDGIYSILSNSKSCAVSAVSNDSGSNIELAAVDLNDTMQQFKVRYAGSGYYTLQSLSSGKWLSVEDNSGEACANVILRRGDSAKGQLWQIIPIGDGYCLVPQCATVCCLDVHNGAIGSPGENIWIYTANCTAAQQFQMVLRRVNVSFDANGGAAGDAFMTGTVDEIDVDRGQYKTVIYTTGGQTIETNKFGTEAAVNANGLVTAVRAYGTDALLTVPEGGFVISSHSTSAANPTAGFVESLTVGDYVDFQPYYMELKAYKSQSDYLVHHKNAVIGGSYGPLPTVTRSGYTFDGWYTAPSGGTQVTSSTTVTASSDHTLYAHWTKQEQPVVPPGTSTDLHFPKVSAYTQGQFTDVPASQWFTPSVASAVELGLMKGNSATTFKPYGDVTLAEAITMAARIHSIYTTGSEPFVQDPGSKWYQVYLDYALENGIITKAYYNCDVNHKATRAQFAEIFANSLPDAGLYPMNSIGEDAIPDVKSTDSYASYVYKLYRAGILTGGDARGTFSPGTYITRAESAAIVSRMAESNNRVAFTLQ